MMASPEPGFRRADKTDLPAIKVFLAANERPIDGVADHLGQFWLAVRGEQIIGSAGLETYGEVALLRSVAVLPEKRNQGIARALVARIVDEATCENVKALYLLTTHAQRYFEGLGFRSLARSDAPKALLASAEFQGACPDSAVLMGLSLVSHGGAIKGSAANALLGERAGAGSTQSNVSQDSSDSARVRRKTR